MVSAEETAIFEAFRATCPDFAGRELKCEPGVDPPDFVGTDGANKRVGIELGEWLNPQQMAVSIARERQKGSFMNALNSEEVEPPNNIGMVWIGKEERVALRAEDAVQFREEIFACIADIDAHWHQNEDWQSPQGYQMNDLSAYPSLAKYHLSLKFIPRTRIPTIKGMAWLTFPLEGGAYTPQDALEALLELIRKKTAMYANLHRKQNLSELYLLVYYDRALIHNTPYIALNFGWDEIVAIAKAEIAKNPGAFQKSILVQFVASRQSGRGVVG